MTMNIIRRMQHIAATKILKVIDITKEIEMHVTHIDNAFKTVYPGMDPKVYKQHLIRDIGRYYLERHGVPHEDEPYFDFKSK